MKDNKSQLAAEQVIKKLQSVDKYFVDQRYFRSYNLRVNIKEVIDYIEINKLESYKERLIKGIGKIPEYQSKSFLRLQILQLIVKLK